MTQATERTPTGSLRIPTGRRIPNAPAARTAAPEQQLSRARVLTILAGLFAGMFTALLSITIVANALPSIIRDLNGTETEYAWVITAALLANAASTPVWGKLADLFSKKLLVQLALVLFVTGSVIGGLAVNVPMLIASRAVQGLGMGGMLSLTQAIIGSIVTPRERGRYQGYLGAVIAVAQTSGPVLGGFLVDSPLGWRSTFFVCVPLAVIALVLLQRTLRLPVLPHGPVHVDWLGSLLLTTSVCTLLIWATLGGTSFPWLSPASFALAIGGLAMLAVTVAVELHVPDPVVPLRLMMRPTLGFATLASLGVGSAMFGSTTFLAQYFQIARGHTPTEAGLLQIPFILGLLASTTVSGSLITKFGAWKPFLIAGAFAMTAGLGLLGSTSHATPLWTVLVYAAVVGLGAGMLMQNLVLAVQNTVDLRHIGTASSAVVFVRTFGGAAGVSVLGSVIAARVSGIVENALIASHTPVGDTGAMNTTNIEALPVALQQVVRDAYADATGTIFLIGAIISVLTLVSVFLIPNRPLRRTLDI